MSNHHRNLFKLNPKILGLKSCKLDFSCSLGLYAQHVSMHLIVLL